MSEEITTLINNIHELATECGTQDKDNADAIRMLANYLAQAVAQFAQGTTRCLNVEAWATQSGNYNPNTNYLEE